MGTRSTSAIKILRKTSGAAPIAAVESNPLLDAINREDAIFRGMAFGEFQDNIKLSQFATPTLYDKIPLISINGLSQMNPFDLYLKGKASKLLDDKKLPDAFRDRRAVGLNPDEETYSKNLFNKIRTLMGVGKEFSESQLAKYHKASFKGRLHNSGSLSNYAIRVPLGDGTEHEGRFEVVINLDFGTPQGSWMYNHHSKDRHIKLDAFNLVLVDRKRKEVIANYSHEDTTYGYTDFILARHDFGKGYLTNTFGMRLLTGVIDELRNYNNRPKANRIESYLG